VSSTFEDLREERDLVIKAALEMGHIPVGMEMFSAADEMQWNIIKKQIDQSDYYVVVVAHRYGSVTDAGISYTEMEYDYAVSKGIPTLGFVLASGVQWPMAKCESDQDAREKLEMFKTKVRQKPVSFWTNKDDLYGKCSIALMKAFNAYPRTGWVRANPSDDDASKEAVRLSVENADLRAKLELYEERDNKAKSFEATMNVFKKTKREVNVFKKDATEWEVAKKTSLYWIYESVAPELHSDQSVVALSRYIAMVVGGVPLAELRSDWPAPRNEVRGFLADFAAFNCVEITRRDEAGNEFWRLTSEGSELLAFMRRRRLERAALDLPKKEVADAAAASPPDAATQVPKPAEKPVKKVRAKKQGGGA